MENLTDRTQKTDKGTRARRMRDPRPRHAKLGKTLTNRTERFELLSKDKIKYSFTIEDPLTFTEPWTGEVAMLRKPKEEIIYEYACHEGNYAFPGIMGGARRLEFEAAAR